MNFLTDIQLKVALVGLIGVIVGALISIIGNYYEGRAEAKRRRSERNYEETKQTYLNVLSFITSLDPEAEGKKGQKYQDDLFNDFSKISSQLYLLASKNVGDKFEQAFKSITERQKDQAKAIADLTKAMQDEMKKLR